MNESFCRVGPIELCYESIGDPRHPTVLLIMGLGLSMDWWRDDLCTDLAAHGFHVVRFDNRDVGRSTHLSGPGISGWVHCGEVLSYLEIARRVGLLDEAEADTFVDEQRRAAAGVGLAPSTVPGSVAELDAYVSRMRPGLRVTPEARAGFRMWANTPAPARLVALRVVYPMLAVLGFALLPGWARRCYGLPAGGPVGDAVATAALRLVRRAMLVLPVRLRGTAEQMRLITRAGAAERQVRTGRRCG